MEVKKIYIERASLRIPSGHIGLISKYRKGAISYSDLPKKVQIIDPKTLEEFDCNLIDILPFKSEIPSILFYISENKEATPENLESLYDKLKSKQPSDLAFYFYVKV